MLPSRTDAAGSDDDALAVMREVGDVVEHLLRIGVEFPHDRADGHLEDKVLAVAPVLTGAAPMGAALGAEMMLVAVVDKGGELRGRLDDDVAAAAAVSAVRAALRHMRLTAERHATGAAVAALDVDAGKVGKLSHENLAFIQRKTPGYARGSPDYHAL